MTVIFNSLAANSVVLGGGTSALSYVQCGTANNVLLSNGSTWISSPMSAGYLVGSIPSAVLGNSSLYVGTTQIALNRSSSSQTLTGISIDGNSATSNNASNLNGQASTYYTNPNNFSTAVPVTKGGTGVTSIAVNSVILGNGTSNVQTISPGSAGNVLTSDGTTWTSSISFYAPPGCVIQFAGSTAPSGWLFCDGSAISRTTYANLFSTIGILYGAGDNVNTFNLPDLRDRVPIGKSSTKVLATTGGSSTLTPSGSISIAGTSLTTDQLPAHNHGVNDSGHVHSVSDPSHRHYISGGLRYSQGYAAGDNVNISLGGESAGWTDYASTGISIAAGGTGISIQNNGSGTTHNHSASFTGTSVSSLPPYIVLNYIIKY